MLLGRAHSNVFDGRRVLGDDEDDAKTGGKGGKEDDEEGGDRVILTGVPERGMVGFLTLFEAYKHVEVRLLGVEHHCFVALLLYRRTSKLETCL